MTSEEALNILRCELNEIKDRRGADFSGVEALDMAIKALEQQPKTGEWIAIGYDYKCTNCEAEINGEINYMSESEIKYCPYCGARMEVEK